MRLSDPPGSTFWSEMGIMVGALLAIGFLLFVVHEALIHFRPDDYLFGHTIAPPEMRERP